MKQAKIKAKDMFEQMLTDRLQACEDTYKSEFNNLMKQFQGALTEIATLKATLEIERKTMNQQETFITSYANLVESVGYDQRLKDKGRDMN